MSLRSKLLQTLACGLLAAASSRCSRSTDEFDSESHFACAEDSDCRSLGANYICIARRCTDFTNEDTSHRDETAGKADAAIDGPAGTSTGEQASVQKEGGTVLQPASIVGFAEKDGTWSLVHMDPVSGTILQRTAIPTISSIAQGITGFDPLARILYVLGDDRDQIHRLFGVDVSNGSVVYSPTVDPALASLEVDETGALFGCELVEFVVCNTCR